MWATTVTGTNMFKLDIVISIYTFLCTEYSSIQSGTYKISSLTKSVSDEREHLINKMFLS